MSNYTKSTNFATKDNLTPGDPLKVVRGTEIDTEFNNISTAIATKTDNSAAAITGGAIDGATVGATTPATGAFTTLAASGTTTLAGALVGAATQSAFNTVSTTLNLGGAATALNLGAATGTATVNNTTLAAKAITASTTLAVTGTSTLTGAVTATAGVSGPITSSSVSITGGSITGITDLAVADGGTGASTAAGGLNNLLPSQTGNASKYLQTDGTNASWDAVSLSTADITGTLGAANGGTGVSNNAAMTVTGSGNFAYTRTLTGTTNVTFPTTGTLATLAGTETLTNKTLTSPTLTTPTLGVATGTSFQGIIGNVTPAAGSFTTLGASSTATLNTLSSSGATLTGGTINGMTVGATTPSSGAFTTVTASTAIGTASGGTGLGGATPFTSGGVVYASSTSALATGAGLSYDGSNLTVGRKINLNFDGVATSGFYDGVSISGYDALGWSGSSSLVLGGYRSSQWSETLFYTGGTERMRLTSTGLGIGTSSPVSKLDVAETATIKRITSGNTMDLNFYNGSGSGTAGNVARIRADGDGVSNDYGALSFWTGRINTASITEKMRLDSAGNLGLGVTPSAWYNIVSALQIKDTSIYSTTNTANFSANEFVNSSAQNIYKNTGFASLYAQNNGSHKFYNAPSGTAGDAISFTQSMTLTSGSTLLIDTTSDNGATGFAFIGSGSSSVQRLIIGHPSGNGSGSQYHEFYYNGGSIGSITQVGTTAVAYNISSDYRLKNITGSITTSGAYIDSLNPVEGTWKSDGSTFVGLIAHEVQEVSRTIVATGTKDGAEMQGMDYSSAELIANLIAEVKSLRQRVATLEAQ